MNTKILNLDDPSSYPEEIKQILFNGDTWSKIQSDNSIYDELIGYAEPVENSFAQKIYRKCFKSLQSNLDYVIVYHLCRTKDEESYRQQGVLVSSQERLEVKARKIFAGVDNLNNAIEESAHYFRTYGDTVSMYISSEYEDVYLREGSHYLRCVAAKLGEEGDQKLSDYNNNVTPYIVSCKVPMSWLLDSSISIIQGEAGLNYYTWALIRRLIWPKANNGEEYSDFRTPIIVFRSIPSKYILKIEAM